MNAEVHPSWDAIHGVSDAVIAPPIWQPMFITPDTTPVWTPAKSAVTD